MLEVSLLYFQNEHTNLKTDGTYKKYVLRQKTEEENNLGGCSWEEWLHFSLLILFQSPDVLNIKVKFCFKHLTLSSVHIFSYKPSNF